MVKNQKIWFITGISSGLGKALAQSVLEKGDFVIGTFRQQAQVDAFHQVHEGKGLALKMDITKTADIKKAFKTIEKQFGRLDVLVNNAGFGFAGAIEETSEAETRQVFEANFFGTLKVTQMALPIMRAQGSGRIVQISSHGGIKAFAGFGIYNASKFALEGFSEALAQELAPLGIHVTIVQPGPFRTGFASSAFQEAAIKMDDYNATAGAFRERMKAVNGKQEGDPEKAAEAIINMVNSENPPLRLPLGKVPMTTIQMKLDSVKKDLEDARAVAESAVFV
jgi:NAD(P)-dependent dehydrogenase (short-subunit alcohol dehydrogenase family)